MSGQEHDSKRPPIATNLRSEAQRLGMNAEAIAQVIFPGRPVVSGERLVRRWLSDEDVNPSWKNVVRLAELCGREPGWFYLDHDDEPAVAA
jgi:hypothetical protein